MTNWGQMKNINYLKKFADFYTIALMNLSLNPENGPNLLKMKFLVILKDLVKEVDENCHCYIHTFIN